MKIFVSSERLRNFNEIFRKDVTYDNIKSHKKARLHPLSRRSKTNQIKSKQIKTNQKLIYNCCQ